MAAGLGALPLKTLAELGGASALAAEGPEADTRRWSRSRPYDGKVVALEPLCTLANDDDKNTWRCATLSLSLPAEVDLGDSGLERVPGDAQGIAIAISAIAASVSCAPFHHIPLQRRD